MRPLIRWTFGMVEKPGFEVFRMAVKRFRAIYPEFDCVICYNNLRERDHLEVLKNMGVDLYEQSTSDLNYPLMPVEKPLGWKGAMPGWGWKLCPPRLRRESHELWVDNDLLIRERLPEIDQWLDSKMSIISKGHRYDMRYYGEFADLVPKNKSCSAGFFGLPPHFDFESAIAEKCQQVLKGRPLGYFDEQGLVTAIVTNQDHIIAHNVEMIKGPVVKPLPKAMHFIATNRLPEHDDWRDFKCSILI